jgi:hypothetical protein
MGVAMKKSILSLIIDALLLLCMAAIAGIGFLMKYVLVAGYRRWEIYEQNVSLFFCGLDRHQWGTIHLIIGIVFLVLLVIHVILHWSLIVTIYRRLIPNRLARWVAALIFVVVVIFLLAFSYFVKPEVVEQGRGQGRGHAQVSCETDCYSKCDTLKSMFYTREG